MRGRKAWIAGLLIVFALVGAARLNPFCLLEPDSSDYLFTSRSLATLEGYREIDHPDRPPHAFRPPGLPLLLVPLSSISPYNVVAAKIVVLAMTLLLLALLYLLARQVNEDRGGVALVLLVVASSPYTLLHATEVMSEVPYVALCLGVLLLLERDDRPPGWRPMIVVGVLLAFLPLVRTIGVALIAAVGLWGLPSRTRWRWSATAAVATIPTLLWTWRNARTGAPGYLAGMRADLAERGLSGFLGRAFESLIDYVGMLIDVVLPGLAPGRPLYERLMLGEAPGLSIPRAIVVVLGLALLVLAARGMWSRRTKEGGLAGAYVALYLIALAVYPPRHERLTWPLVPLLWVYVPLGATWVSGTARRRVGAVGYVGVALLVLWQAVACVRMVTPNVMMLRDPDRFHAEHVPPMYYNDWQAAGRFIADSSEAFERVLTRHSDVGFTARRFQDAVRFEELSPVEWRGRMASLPARYLVLPTTLFGKLVDSTALSNDPVYTYDAVYDARGVLVLEVRPNDTGTVPASRRDVEDGIAACTEARRRHPGRVDLTRRLAELLSEGGRGKEAVELLNDAIAASPEVGLYKTLGDVLLELDRPDEALEAFRAASERPDADLLAASIERGTRRAERRLTAGPETAAELLALARANMEILRFGKALDAGERALALSPDDPGVQLTYGKILQRLGRFEEASEAYRSAGAHDPAILQRLALVEPVELTEETVSPLAELYVRDGTPGRALALLSDALLRWGPSDPDWLRRVADLALFYGLIDWTEGFYETVGDRAGIERRERLSRPAEF